LAEHPQALRANMPMTNAHVPRIQPGSVEKGWITLNAPASTTSKTCKCQCLIEKDGVLTCAAGATILLGATMLGKNGFVVRAMSKIGGNMSTTRRFLRGILVTSV